MIMNKRGVALATDSALSVRSPLDGFSAHKIWHSATKIHSLSETAPVAVVITGSTEFMGFPWSTVVEIYRNEMRRETYDELRSYGKSLLEFLQRSTIFGNSENQARHVLSVVTEGLDYVSEKIEAKILRHRRERGGVDKNRERALFEEILEDQRQLMANRREQENLPSDYDRAFRLRYEDIVKSSVYSKCWTYTLEGDENRFKGLEELSWDIILGWFKRESGLWSSSGESELAIVGYGEREEFPSVVVYSIQGIANDCLKWFEKSRYEVDWDHQAELRVIGQGGAIQQFLGEADRRIVESLAQQIANAFVIVLRNLVSSDKYISEDIREGTTKILQIIESLSTSEIITELIMESSRTEMLSVVASLPLVELAYTAEKLVDFTVFREQFDFHRPTVGGAIDLAVLSKRQGLEWVRSTQRNKS